MAAPREVRALIQRFQENRASYLSGPYNETQTRREFVDPFFTALGWDVANASGYAEAYKDVVHEDAIMIGGMTKAPDYSFRVGGARKFFVETKRPAVKIRDDAAAAFLSILTNFAEFSVYDCRVKPERSDPASTARILYLACDEYEARWDELAGIFAKESVLKGSFDRYAESAKKKRGTAEVDTAFLKEIESWREKLAHNLALRNPGLSQRELNFAVQRTIDRIIFLRICEDRGIEPYGGLQGLLSGPNVYARLGELFRRADERYNSGLFHFRPEKGRPEPPDELSLGLAVDDKVVKDILRRLYYPDSPYEFSVLPADILGQVYEQFLGKVIRLTPGHRAVVEEKPEVRKAGGVYYTPTYIVDYIVKNTVGELLTGETPQEVGGFTKNWRPSKKLHPLRVLDPACGSGSFLLGAYQYLLDWYRDRYVEDGPEKHAKGRNPRLYRIASPSPSGRGVGGEGEWRLTTAERKRILLTHIYGVDIDPQAVEVTKLSLLLKVLEGETQETLDSFYRLFQERALPDLGANIKCGNSLIGPDFFAGAEYSLLDEEERYRINPFDWYAEFPDVFSGDSPGFDAVIGNPPYVLLQTLKQPSVFTYLSCSYRSAQFKIDTYYVFLERALQLASLGARVSYITPSSYLRNKHARALRSLILESAEVELLRVFQYPVFQGASVDTTITVLRRCSEPDPEHRATVSIAYEKGSRGRTVQLPQAVWAAHPERHFSVPVGGAGSELATRIEQRSIPLGAFATAYFGVQTYDRKRYVAPTPQGSSFRPAIDGVNIQRYLLMSPREYVDFRPEAVKSGGKESVYERERVGVRQIGEVPVATLLPAGVYTLNTIYNIYPVKQTEYDLLFVLGLLVSRAGAWYWRQSFFDQKRTFPKIKKDALLRFPVARIDFSDPADKARHDRMVSLVQTMLDLHKRLAAAKTAHEKTILERQITATDHQIDQLVYKLYGLTADEIKIVEEATTRA
ncbi:MAG TPA: TaqI-like C-terminal specificity domain-containing protein [Thermoanaerobaculia bacterium]|nr:TaqI-like C-terminal specificity domain-containing protein [Thermoanaerobaculia bacterium]